MIFLKRLISAGLLTLGLLIQIASHSFAEDKALPLILLNGTTPANLTDKDKGDTLPVALFRGQVSNQLSRYILGPGDIVFVAIKDLEKFNQKLTIRPDGYATIHPFGEYYISGTDIQGLESWLKEKFKHYLLRPEITVDIVEMRPAIVYITGAVQHPGTYQFIRQGLNNATLVSPAQEKVEITLSNILAKAGGVTEFADLENIQVQHVSTGAKESFNLKELLTHGQFKDVWLLPGDTVIIPQMKAPMDPDTFRLVSRSTFYRDKFPVVVLGAVHHQGEVQMDPGNNSLNAAIALAGGFIPKLSKRDEIIVQRPGNNGGFSRWNVNRQKSNLELLPGDVVYVMDSKVATTERAFQFLNSIAAPYFYSVNAMEMTRRLTVPLPTP